MNMRKAISAAGAGIIAGISLLATFALADYPIKDGVGASQTIFAFVCFTTKICPTHVNTTSAGVETFTASVPGRIDPTGTTPQPVTQSGSWTVSRTALAPVPTSLSALVSCQVLKASAGSLYSVTVTVGATSGYLMLFDATSAPGDGAVTTRWPAIPVVSNGTFGALSLSFADVPLTFGTGMTACFSTTGPFSKTASATAAISGQVQ